MRALVFSDLHASYKYLSKIKELILNDDSLEIILFAGDLVNMGEPVGFVEKFIEMIELAGRPLFWVPGNNDFGRSYHKLHARYKSVEGRVATYSPSSVIPAQAGIQAPKSIHITGVGGSPASWGGQYAGENLIDKKSIAGSIFLSHVPPPGILAMQRGDCASSASVNSNIEYRISKQIPNSNSEKSKHVSDLGFRASGLRLSDSPIVHICGHQHSRWGCGYLGSTKVINPGPAVDGHYAILEMENLKVEFLRF